MTSDTCTRFLSISSLLTLQFLYLQTDPCPPPPAEEAQAVSLREVEDDDSTDEEEGGGESEEKRKKGEKMLAAVAHVWKTLLKLGTESRKLYCLCHTQKTIQTATVTKSKDTCLRRKHKLKNNVKHFEIEQSEEAAVWMV